MRAWLVSIALACGFAAFVTAVSPHYPVRHWLFPRYLGYWLACMYMTGACLVSGLGVVRRLGGDTLSLGESLLIGLSCGVLLFALGVFVAGVLGLYGRAFFFGWPAALALSAGREPWQKLANVARQAARDAREGARSWLPQSTFELARAAFLGVALVGLYLQVLAPENISYDARWYHLSIAEQYAAQGAIRPFAEGWYLGAYPQLATWLYTWAFLLPGSLFDHVTLAAHLEWFLFLATVPGIGLLARRLLPHTRVRWAGGALFLFPSLFLYDTNLNASADHIHAFWAVPLALAVAAAARSPRLGSVLLVTIPAAGAALTRYQAIYLLVPAALVLLAVLIRDRRLALILPAFAAILVLTAPHWLKNVIYYGDPVYPMLHDYLPSHPFYRGAADAMEGAYVPTRFQLLGTAKDRLFETLDALPTFAFVPHNWKNLHLRQPTFGSLFTLLGLALPFLTKAGRIWVLMGCSYLGVAIWFSTNHQDRFLQALVPWMATCVAALCVRIWRLGLAPRLALAALVGLQIVWGADFYFAANHTIIHHSLISAAADHLNAGIAGKYEERFRHWGKLAEVDAELPRNAVLLMHDGGLRLGLERRVVSDEYGYQGGLSYTELESPRAIWQAWHDLGVTHVMWKPARDKHANAAKRAREAIFFNAVRLDTRRRRHVHGFDVAELTRQPPPAQDEAEDRACLPDR